MKRIIIPLLLCSTASMALDYKAMYLKAVKETQEIKEKINTIKQERELYLDYKKLYKDIDERFKNEPKKVLNYTSTARTPVKQYLDYKYIISEHHVTNYINSNLIDFHKDQIDEMVISIQANKPSVTVTLDEDYKVYINGKLLTLNEE